MTLINDQLAASDLVTLINRFPKSGHNVIHSIDRPYGLLGQFPQIFHMTGFILREEEGVEGVWRNIRPQLMFEGPVPGEPLYGIR